jgi:hypothetical protein
MWRISGHEHVGISPTTNILGTIPAKNALEYFWSRKLLEYFTFSGHEN